MRFLELRNLIAGMDLTGCLLTADAARQGRFDAGEY